MQLSEEIADGKGLFLSAIHFEKPLHEDQLFRKRFQSNTKKNSNRYIGFQGFRSLKLRIKKGKNVNGIIKTKTLDKARIAAIALSGRSLFFL